MAQHFLLSAAARSLSAAKIMRMSDRGVENVFRRLRWPDTDGRPVCPGCGCTICYACPRSAAHPRWRCKACQGDFSITSGTLFAWHKLPLRTYLLAVAAFCNEVKGKSMLALARELDVQYKTALCGRPAGVKLLKRAYEKPIPESPPIRVCRLMPRGTSEIRFIIQFFEPRFRLFVWESGQMRPYVRPSVRRQMPLAIMGVRVRGRHQSSWRAQDTRGLAVLPGLS